MNLWPPSKFVDLSGGVKPGELLQVGTNGLALSWRSNKIMQDRQPGLSSHILDLIDFSLVEADLFEHTAAVSLGGDLTVSPDHSGFFTDDISLAKDGDILLHDELYIFAKYQERTQLIGLNGGVRLLVGGQTRGLVFRSWKLRIGPSDQPYTVLDPGRRKVV